MKSVRPSRRSGPECVSSSQPFQPGGVARDRCPLVRRPFPMTDTTASNDRRDFLTQVGAGAIAMLGTPALLHAAPGSSAPPMNEKWLDNLKGKYRQYFDATTVDSGFSLAYAMNWMDTMKAAY